MKPYEKICEEDPQGQAEARCHRYTNCKDGCPRFAELEQLKSIGVIKGKPLPLHWKV